MPVKGVRIEPAAGKLGVLLPGIGAVSTTFIAGVEAVKKGLAKPIGSLTQMGTIRLGKRTEHRVPAIKGFVPLASLEDLVFGGWDIYPEDAYHAAINAGVLDPSLLEAVRPELKKIRPWPAVFDQHYVKRLRGSHVKKAKNKMDLAEQLRDDIEIFRKKHRLSRLVMVWTGSTESFQTPKPVHQTVASFEKGLAKNDPAIAPSMIYAYAAIQAGIPYANGAPNLSADIPALTRLAGDRGVPICGKDFKTGQTLLKTVLAPGLKSRLLGLSGWFSTNILGNRDGEVLEDPGSFKTKEESKLSALEHILQPKLYPRRQQGGLGQHRHFRLVGIPDANQSQFSMSRFHPRGAPGLGPRVVPGPRKSLRHEGNSRMVFLLFQKPDVRAGLISRA